MKIMKFNKSEDMTSGSPMKHLLHFSGPLAITYIFQQLYTLADAVIVGRLIGTTAYAAVGVAASYTWLLLSVVLGFTQGCGILYGNRFGGKNENGLKSAIGTSVWITGCLAVILTVLGILLARPAMGLIDTPAELEEQTLVYIYWMTGGIAASLAYNMAGTLLRAMGNSSTSMIAAILSSILNVVLDFLLAGIFSMGVAGVALGTILANLFAFGYCLSVLRKVPEVKLSGRYYRPERNDLHELLRLSAPIAVRNLVISAGGLVVQKIINGYGTYVIAGITAAKKYYGIMEIAGAALEGAVAAFVAQNYGKRDWRRIRQGVRSARLMGGIASGMITILMILSGRTLIGLMVKAGTDGYAVVVESGYCYLVIISICLPMLYMLFIHRAAIQSIGGTGIPLASGFAELGCRLFSVLVITSVAGVRGVYIADGLGWLAAGILLMAGYHIILKKQEIFNRS